MAVGLGFEPRLMGPKPIVLPLDDPTIFIFNEHILMYFNKKINFFWIDKNNLLKLIQMEAEQ